MFPPTGDNDENAQEELPRAPPSSPGSLSDIHRSRKQKIKAAKKKNLNILDELQNLTKCLENDENGNISSDELKEVSSGISNMLSDKNTGDTIKNLLSGGGMPDLSSLLVNLNTRDSSRS